MGLGDHLTRRRSSLPDVGRLGRQPAHELGGRGDRYPLARRVRAADIRAERLELAHAPFAIDDGGDDPVLGEEGLVTVARLDPVKDFPCLLNAFALVRQVVPHAVLVMVGDGPERAALVERAAQPDLAGSIVFLGLRPDVRAVLPAADLYVNSSISEGISITILEAMASGVPVVATSAGGTPEVLADGSAGVLVPVRNPIRLAQAMISLAADPGARANLATLGRRRVESSFTIQRMVAEYARLYHGLLD